MGVGSFHGLGVTSMEVGGSSRGSRWKLPREQTEKHIAWKTVSSGHRAILYCGRFSGIKLYFIAIVFRTSSYTLLQWFPRTQKCVSVYETPGLKPGKRNDEPQRTRKHVYVTDRKEQVRSHVTRKTDKEDES